MSRPGARPTVPPEPPGGDWTSPTSDSEIASVTELLDVVTTFDRVPAVSGHVLEAIASGRARWLLATDSPDAPDAPGPDGPDGPVGPVGTDEPDRPDRPDGPVGTDGPGGQRHRDAADTPLLAVIGVAAAVSGDPAEVAVHPDHRGRGLGGALVRAAVRRQGAVWAYGDLPPARAVAARLGLIGSRELLQLRRALPLTPEPGAASPPDRTSGGLGSDAGLPAGVRIRPFRPGVDEDAIVAVNARAFAWHPEQGRMTLADLHEQMAQDWFDPAGLLVAVWGGESDPDGRVDAGQHGARDGREPERVLGFHWTKRHPAVGDAAAGGRAEAIGEVYVLAVDPESPVRGLGRPLTLAGLAHLAAQGLPAVMLYVEADNDRARRLYERLGFSLARSNVVYAPARAPSPAG